MNFKLLTIFLLLSCLVSESWQDESLETDSIASETAEEVPKVDEDTASGGLLSQSGSEPSGVSGGGGGEKINEAAVIQEATEKLEKMNEKPVEGVAETESEQVAPVAELRAQPEAAAAPAAAENEPKSEVVEESAKSEPIVVVDEKQQEAPKEVETNDKSENVVVDTEPKTEAVKSNPEVVESPKSEVNEPAAAPAAPVKSNDVEYVDDDIKAPADVRSDDSSVLSSSGGQSNPDTQTETKSDPKDDPLVLKPEPVKSGASVAADTNVPPKSAVDSQPEPKVEVQPDNSKPSPIHKSGKVNEFFIIVPAIVLAAILLILIAFVVYYKKHRYDPVATQEARTNNPIYKGAETV